MTEINWFPGHMAKAIRLLKEQLEACEFVLEICDARIPQSSRNPELAKLLLNKPSLLLLNKEDLAQAESTAAWLRFYHSQGVKAIACDSRQKKLVQMVEAKIIELNQSKIDSALNRGRRERPIRVLVAGIPNCGKSSLINTFCQRHSAKVADMPGVTRGLTWLRAGTRLALLDTPGLLWPKLESRQEQISLGVCAAVRDTILPQEELGGELILRLAELRCRGFAERYQINLAEYTKLKGEDTTTAALRVLEQLAQHCKVLKKEGKVDRAKAAQMLINDFRKGRLGRVTLENPL